MPISVFKRYEKKYMLNMKQYRETIDFLSDYMTFDKYCIDEKSYGLLNIYYDTPDNILIGRSVQKPIYKEKLRLRSYFLPENDDSRVFFEIKQKYDGCVTKRRAVMTYGEAKYLSETGNAPAIKNASYIDNQVAKEISQMFVRYPGLAPSVFVSYSRMAMFGKQDRELRVTFDKEIIVRHNNPTFDYGLDGESILPDNSILMEIKIPNCLPLWLAHYLSENSIFNTSFSKYGKEYEYRILGRNNSEDLKNEI